MMKKFTAALGAAFLLLSVFLFAPVRKVAATSFTKMFSVWIQNSLIDSTPIGSTTPSSGAFTFTSSSTSTNTITNQGAYLEWNIGTIGETDFVNLHGSGVGGFNFYNGSNGSTLGRIAWIDQSGNVFGNTFNGPLSGNATSATQFATAPATCAGTPNTWLQGINANGTPNSCVQPFASNLGNGTTGSGAVVLASGATLSGNFTGPLSGNASTATALAGSPSQCLTGATGIAANGNANCISSTYLVQYASTTATCPTGSTSFASCDTTLHWPVAFADTNYGVSCQGGSPNDPRAALPSWSGQTTTSITTQTVTEGATAVQYATIYCIGVHN